MEKTMDKIIALAKARGFVYPGSEIYGGLANTWDYGNLGVELKNNVKRAWWQKFIQESPYNVGVDCAILMNPQTWIASGHLGSFSDPLMDCKECHERFRADKIIEDFAAENNIELKGSVDGWTQEEMKALVQAAKGIPVKLITEIGVLNKEQINEVCEMAIEAGITSLVTSAGFMPYEVPFAGKEAYETIVSASKGKLEIIANENIQTKEQVEELFKLGIHKVCTTKAYEILKK